MRNAWVLAGKDARSYFNSWTGILILFFFSVISGVFFLLPLITYVKMSLQVAAEQMPGLPGFSVTRFVYNSLFVNLGNLLMFIIPFLSMRALAEEKNLQTLELLYTYPISDGDILIGKFLGMLRFLFFMVLPTGTYLVALRWVGAGLDLGAVGMCYLGFALLCGAYLSLGLYMSSVAPSQVMSAILTFCSILVFWILEWVAGMTDGRWARFFTILSPLNHYKNFTLGILDLSDLVYFLFFQLYFLFLALRSIEARNWRG